MILRSGESNPSINRSHKDYNIDKWGSDRNHNVLYVTGVSGSGKSTIAKELSKSNKADVINIDLYTFKTPNAKMQGMSKQFNQYLDANNPGWRKRQGAAYSVLTKNDRRKQKLAGQWFDELEDAIQKYGENSYGKRKIVAEGVQILDETLFYNNKTALKDKPLIIMNTSMADSLVSRIVRDNKSIDKLLEPERVRQYEGWIAGLDVLRKTMEEI